MLHSNGWLLLLPAARHHSNHTYTNENVYAVEKGEMF